MRWADGSGVIWSLGGETIMSAVSVLIGSVGPAFWSKLVRKT